MLIESWPMNASYEKSFDECELNACTYILVERYNNVYVITTLLGLYDGITVLLKLFAPFMTRHSYEYLRKFPHGTRQVMPCD